MRKILYPLSLMAFLFFSSLLLLPDKIQSKVSDVFYGTLFAPVYQTVISPILATCPFQHSKLACQLNDWESIKSSCFINGAVLQDKLKKGLPQWAMDQIQEDLSHFPVIKKTELRKVLNENAPQNTLSLFQIKNKKVIASSNVQLHMESNRAHKVILYAVEYLAQKGYIPDTEFVLALADNYTPINERSIPIFTFAKDQNIPVEKDLILIPDWQNLGSTPNLRQRIRSANQLTPWGDKKSVLFWRGGKLDSTGFRKRLVSFSKEHPTLIDAEFVTHYGKKKDVHSFIKPEDHLKYKYLASVDGQRCSWERLIWHLHSNSLVFKHLSSQTQWFYKGIKPFEHYIPMTDENSILTNITWAENHPQEVQSIIHNATTFVEENLQLEDIYHYIAVLLQEYHKRLQQ